MTMNNISTLLDIRINTLGDRLSILQHIQSKSNFPTVTAKPIVPATAKTATQHSELNYAQFRKLKLDQDVYKRLTLLLPTQIASSLYDAWDDSVQNTIAKSIQNTFTLAEVDILTVLEKIVTHQVNPAIHCTLAHTIQNCQESI